MPENLVMTSAYSVYPYRPQGRGKKKLNRVGKGAPDIAFRFGAKKKNKTKQNKIEHLEATNRVAFSEHLTLDTCPHHKHSSA